MRSKVKGMILAVVGGIGTVWALVNATLWMPWIIAFTFCTVICVDGIATVATEIRTDREIKKAREKYALPEFLNLDEEE